MDRGSIAEIDLNAIAHNFRAVRKITKNKKVIAVVKADAYGHGAVEAARRLVKEGASSLAVAYISEAIALREAGIKSPVIVLFDKYNISDFFKYNLIPVIHDIKTAQRFSKEAGKKRRALNVHLKIDTGMGRLGFNTEHIEKEISIIAKMNSILITGLMSHFSDADLSDRSHALMQLERFNYAKNILKRKNIKPQICHMANSAAVISLPESHLDAVRPGLMLYGCSPVQNEVSRYQGAKVSRKVQSLETLNPRNLEPSLIPSMTIKTKILSLRKVKKGTPISYGRTFITTRESLIAVLPVGYADGYPRSLSNIADVIIRGKRAPITGRICMDTIMADVTDIKGVSEGDEVVMLGKQKGAVITASELAVKAGTISYEILTSLGNKSRKVHIGSR